MELSIEKKGWGYVCLSIEAEGDFLSLEKKKILEEDFKGNTYQLPIYVDEKKLHQGKNWGEIMIRSPYETIKVPVLVSQNQHHRMRPAIEKRKNAKWLKSRLTNTYIHFRSKKVAALRFKKESEEILDAIKAGYVSYVINTRAILSGVHYEDGIAIRRTASQNNVTTLTSLDTVKVLLDVLEEITIGVSPIDE